MRSGNAYYGSQLRCHSRILLGSRADSPAPSSEMSVPTRVAGHAAKNFVPEVTVRSTERGKTCAQISSPYFLRNRASFVGNTKECRMNESHDFTKTNPPWRASRLTSPFSQIPRTQAFERWTLSVICDLQSTFRFT